MLTSVFESGQLELSSGILQYSPTQPFLQWTETKRGSEIIALVSEWKMIEHLIPTGRKVTLSSITWLSQSIKNKNLPDKCYTLIFVLICPVVRVKASNLFSLSEFHTFP